VFEIGQQLAEQRRRRSLSLADCEHATKIRAKFLAALEDDRVDALPDPAYGRIFLRDYARFLELDADALVTEFDERYGVLGASAEHQVLAPEPVEHRQGARLVGQIATLHGASHPKLAWLGIGAALALGGLVWLGQTSSSGPPTANITSRPAPPRSAHAPAVRHRAPATSVMLVLTGTGTGGSYVLVRRPDSGGAVVYEGTLSSGTSVHFAVSQPLWMRVGWTPRLRVVLGGHLVTLSGGTADFTVTRAGVSTAA
jgi:cytoskeleton protein RodZ